MTLKVERRHPRFFGEITGADLTREPDAQLVSFVEQAMADHAVCVVRQEPITDEEHLRFARAFGPLELPPNYEAAKADPTRRMAAELFSAGNLGPDGRIRPAIPRERDVSVGAEKFHSDSSFNTLPSKWSMLRGVACPPSEVGGDTLFVDMRAAWDDLPADMQRRVEGLVGVHDFWKGRERAGLKPDERMRQGFRIEPVTHPLVRTMPDGRRYLYCGAHCTGIEGWSEEEGWALVSELYDHATQDKYVHCHEWTVGDIVVWENRCAMHAATPLTSDVYPRDMRRATVNEA